MRSFFILLLCLTSKLYGQEPVEVKFYLNNRQVSKNAKDFYFEKFKASDDDNSFSIVDSLMTKNNKTRPFYIFLVSKMIEKADGVLSESLGHSCKNFIELHPDFLIDFLFSKNEIIEKIFIENWANQIAGEFKIDCEGKEKPCINKSLQLAMTKSELKNKTRLTNFYKIVESYSR